MAVACMCLCTSHLLEAEGICTHQATVYLRAKTPLDGEKKIPMCRPCHDAQSNRFAFGRGAR